MTIAIVGGGIAGLSCARALVGAGHRVTIFDKGRRAPGGRVSSREGMDFGAAYLRSKSATFSAELRRWEAAGTVAPWSGVVIQLETGEAITRRRWVGLPDMNAIPRHLAAGLDVRQGVRVVEVHDRGVWELRDDERTLGLFDSLVVATPAAQALSLLSAAPELASQVSLIEHHPTLAALVKFEQRIDVRWDAATSRGPLAWMSRESSKPGRPVGEAWVLGLSAAASADFLEEPKDTFALRALGLFRDALGRALPTPSLLRGHRWRYAQARRPLGIPCLWDPARRVGACGDGFLGSHIEHAWESGTALAALVQGRSRSGS